VEINSEQLAALIDRVPRPPMVRVTLLDELVPAALLVWTRSTSGTGGPVSATSTRTGTPERS